ncbi:hypothetical protein Desmu_0454 [Desulfurococcus mucosus DSM 2162]|uniref:4Fe-4S ferredoxin n=1 Tax=Desulfurococcus mucosus (strain ATCC 35584 / DSM 2162 / JCM 9187 / O7/1) TaxID=765177 RepID=E8R8E2_DESM0|nr:hypothetical protein [Desulfurococcus mucosus]ADV64768.1 hypothetical protein Desmu_0454 [Desulfurococcus mucosus DSM 2162]
MYILPRLIDVNAKASILREAKRILVAGRCVESEHREILEEVAGKGGYVVLTACPEAEHVNMLGFKLAGILARGSYEEVAVLTVDGSLHCTQLHWMLEEVCKISGKCPARRHIVIYKGKPREISVEAVKASRFLYRVDKLLGSSGGAPVD